MNRFGVLIVASLASLSACQPKPPAAGNHAPGDSSSPDASAPTDGSTEPASDAGSEQRDAGAHDLGRGPADLGPVCKKHLTVVFAVGTGAGAVGSLSNGCWSVTDADGAANHSFRKCSTSTFAVVNPSAANYAYDDTNPTRPLSDDQTFLSQCSSGATGEGFEYMAYRGSAWRLLTATHMKAYFAELYSSDSTVDDYFSLWPKTLSGHAVSPMINIGPNDAATIESAATNMCKPLTDGGYFGVYNADWQTPMAPTDARAKAVATALNNCTR